MVLFGVKTFGAQEETRQGSRSPYAEVEEMKANCTAVLTHSHSPDGATFDAAIGKIT